jgi:hypothetical protein
MFFFQKIFIFTVILLIHLMNLIRYAYFDWKLFFLFHNNFWVNKVNIKMYFVYGNV